MNNYEIRYIVFDEIDFVKWDNCIKNSLNSRVYALSWFLNHTADRWDALVYGDYLFVMPLPVRKKFGIRYLYQPFFCQQLGIFPTPSSEIQTIFATELVKRFKYADFQINSQNQPQFFSEFKCIERINLILPLVENYPSLFAGFSKNTQRNIKRAENERVPIVNGVAIGEFLEMKKRHNKGNAPLNSFDSLNRLISVSISNRQGMILGAYSIDNELCAGVFLLKSLTRITYLSAFSTRLGKQNLAMYGILDWILKKWAGSGYLLDFEGSNIEGVARFYKGFGAYSEAYFRLKRNVLPFPVRMFKK
jgi:hypothetical protein